MREIKFRVWDKLNKKYREFDGMHDTMMMINKDGKVEYYNLQNGSGGNEYILEQFTGLHDKNGKMIFKGDIVEFSYFNNVHKAEVVYNNKTCGFEVRYFTVVGAYGERALHSINFANIENIKVIGNIHDNPELQLEEQEQ